LLNGEELFLAFVFLSPFMINGNSPLPEGKKILEIIQLADFNNSKSENWQLIIKEDRGVVR